MKDPSKNYKKDKTKIKLLKGSIQEYSPIILSLLLISCSSNPEITRIGPGVIKCEQQLISAEQLKKDETKKDVLNGAGIGASSEVAVGAGSGAMIGASGGYIYVSNKDDILSNH